MYDIARNRKRQPGKCELCGNFDDHLERHHIKYSPEITRLLCHKCHFTAHYYPDRLNHVQKVLLLNKVMSLSEAFNFATKYAKDREKLAKAFAPSKRKAIREAQKLGKPMSFKPKDINIIGRHSKGNRNS